MIWNDYYSLCQLQLWIIVGIIGFVSLIYISKNINILIKLIKKIFKKK